MSGLAALRKLKMDDYVFPFEKLEIWKLAVDLADFILELLERFPQNKHFRLVSQMEAAVSSIAQNVAEGKGRQYKKEFIQYLYIAIGSLFEVLTLTELFTRRKLISGEEAVTIREQAKTIHRKTYSLINALKKK